MRSFGTVMPFMGIRIQAKTPETRGIAEKVQTLFRKFHAIAGQARQAEIRILNLEASGASVPESLYREYEDLLAQAVAAHELYAASRQELRDMRAEERGGMKGRDLGCA